MQISLPVTADESREARVPFSPRCLARILIAIIATLTLLSVVGHLVKYLLLDGRSRWFLVYFDLNWEESIGTYYQGIGLLLSAILLAILWRLPGVGSEPNPRWWLFLSVVFLCLSFDEYSEIHEMIGFAMKSRFKTQGFFAYAWVIPGLAVAGTFGAICIRFLYQLPVRTRLSFIVAGIIFVGGAVGIEMISGKYSDLHGDGNLTYCLISDFEELFEMTGIAIFNVALTTYLAQRRGGLVVSFDSGNSDR